MVQITQEEYNKLQDKSAKLIALENGGVDNWEGYDISLEPYHKLKELEEKLDNLIQDIEEIVGTDSEIETDPAGFGTGYSIHINKSAVRNAIKEYFKEIK